MKVRTRTFSETPSVRTRTANWACTVFGTRATNFPDAMPLLFGAGTSNFLAFSAATVALSASRPFSTASSTVSPSEMHSAKSGNEMSYPGFENPIAPSSSLPQRSAMMSRA